MRLRKLLGLVAFGVAACITPVLAQGGSTIGTLTIPTMASPPPLNPRAPAGDWKGAAPVPMPWDVTHQRSASELSSALIGTDGPSLYVRFDVKQREGLLAQQHINNVGDGTDDEVWIDLWPNGPGGFFYQFAATSNGTHFQYSSENTAYAPTWESYGVAFNGGFTITMKIPLKVIRGSRASGSWRAQFVRVIRSTGERQIWSYAAAQTNGDDVTYAGGINGLAAAQAIRPQARFAPYALGAMGAKGTGLSTSRVGMDLAIPITETASFVSTLHPDYSNLEIDQETISPTAFARFYSETRPFFTQLSNYFNNFNCDACPGIQEFYSPNIPTPREGYAIEGSQGRSQFAAFDAIAVGRSDAAQAFSTVTADNQLKFTAQRISSDCDAMLSNTCPDSPFVHDDIDTTGVSYNDNKHVSAYFNYGSDSGSNVLVPDQAQRYDGGAYIYTNTFGAAFSMRKVGYFYNPVDGLVQHPDIAGYAFYTAKEWLFTKNDFLNEAGLDVFFDRYHNAAGDLDQSDSSMQIDLLTASRIDVTATIGSSYLLANNCATSVGDLIAVTPLNYGAYRSCQVFTPVSNNGLAVTWHSGTANSPGNFPNHGSSSTPTTISFNTGNFGPGRLDSWLRSSSMRVGMRGLITLEADDTRQYLLTGATNVQWLERAGYTYALGADESMSFGIRRIIGIAPFIVSNDPASCTTVIFLPATTCTGAWNLSFAFHKRTPKDEYYFAYGDASQLSTVPQWVLKWIHYVGAEKGT
jgi:Domain of unknown function (DUF5916)